MRYADLKPGDLLIIPVKRIDKMFAFAFIMKMVIGVDVVQSFKDPIQITWFNLTHGDKFTRRRYSLYDGISPNTEVMRYE